MSKPLIVVTGKNGQLGCELQQLSSVFSDRFDFLFTDKNELDLSKPSTLSSFIEKNSPQIFINCAAYTLVDKAETEQELAYTINAESVGVLAKACANINCTFITISTDYVFNGNGKEPYKPEQQTEPINYYGYTKWLGEKLAVENNSQAIVIRTSWVYSTHGNNFVKTMLRLMKERQELKVVSDQIGSPTYAKDLANVIIQMVIHLSTQNTLCTKNIYHFSNEGVISWFDFASAIQRLSGLNCNVLPIPSSAYPTPAKRPFYSVLDKQDIVKDFSVSLTNWEDSLKDCIDKLLAQ
jgi:dTDP-4-dehydrorhamnose reductase